MVRHPRNDPSPFTSGPGYLLAWQVSAHWHGVLGMQITRAHAHRLTLTGAAHVVGTLGPFHLLNTGEFFE